MTFYNLSVNPSRPDPGQREKINLNFHFHTSLWCLKRFYETFSDIAKKCENKNLKASLHRYNFCYNSTLIRIITIL